MSTERRLLFVLALFAGAGCVGLSGWQLGRLFDRRARNRTALAQRDLPVVDLARTGLPGAVSYRRVTVTGRFDFDHEIVLRGRLFQGAPGIHVVTPLRIPGRDTAVMVNRGFVPTPDAGSIADPARYREAEDATLTGIAAAIPDDRDGDPITTKRGESWRRLDLSAIRRRVPYPIASYYLIIEPPAEGAGHTLRGHSLPVRVDPPPLDDGPHLSYAVQWFLIAGAILGFGFFFILKGRPARG